MDLEKIEKLVKIIENSSILEFSFEEEDMRISLLKESQANGVVVQRTEPVSDVMEAESEEAEELYITSPIVGTFYSAPSPETPAFVRVGDIAKKGQPVCIVEAMKLMNEINCDYDCEIEAVLVSNEQKVEYGQPLFRVKKLSE